MSPIVNVSRLFKNKHEKCLRYRPKKNQKVVVRHWLWETFSFSFLRQRLQKSKKSRMVFTFGDIFLFIFETMSSKVKSQDF